MIWATLILFTCAADGSDCRGETVATMPMLQCNVMWQIAAAKIVSETGRVFVDYECLPGTGGA